MKGSFPTELFEGVETPFYYYDTALLRETLRAINSEVSKHDNWHVHYAIKANANPKVLNVICQAGLGADCVSGGEIQACVNAGFPGRKIVFAGVGKSDWEINLGLDKNILCFNVESIPELEVINELAAKKGKVARVAFRINPDVGAHTHANITTGMAENKFGIAMRDMEDVIAMAAEMKNVTFVGLHFHIGSQILDMGDFRTLCNRINELQDQLDRHHIKVGSINVGGGLGVDYMHPNRLPLPDFKAYFDTFARHLRLRPGQTLHFELGRAVVAHQAYHKIENISSDEPCETYDVVGPICESSDVFVKAADINKVHRGDLLAIRSAGAYGEIMASQYNCRKMPKGYIAEDF